MRRERKGRKRRFRAFASPSTLSSLSCPSPPLRSVYSAPHCLGAPHAFSALKKGGYTLKKYLPREWQVIFHDTDRMLEVASIAGSNKRQIILSAMNLEDALSNLSLYDAKKYFRKAQNVVFNYTEMEAKVREATNNEPWGASSTLMEQIAQGTYNIREREEILVMIFRRFTEKSGSEWRQIYKALQLLDYLIKHGSERFIDDTRNSIKLIEMLETFHYIDSEGRDQGINVRNKAKQLTTLLRDDDAIRQERRKARETAKKYRGVSSASSTPGGAFNPKAGFRASSSKEISVSADYDSDNEDVQPYGMSGSGRNASGKAAKSKGTSKSKSTSRRENDIFTFGDDEGDSTGNATTQGATQKQDQSLFEDESDDEFTEFQSALPVSASSTKTSAPAAATNSLADLDFGSLQSNISHPPAQTGVIPAIAGTSNNKRNDPFSSLFSEAKSSREQSPSPKPVTQPIQQKQPTIPSNLSSKPTVTNNNNDDSDDDLFGDMTSAVPAASSVPQAQANNNNNSGNQSGQANGEIDLLSF